MLLAAIGVALVAVGLASSAAASTPASISVTSISRDASTGNLNYDVTVSSSSYALPGETCESTGSSCYVYLVGTRLDGSVIYLDFTTITAGSSATYPMNKRFQGSIRTSQIASVYGYISGIGASQTSPVVVDLRNEMSAPAETVANSLSLQAIAKAVSANAKTKPP